jgi:O-antigen ligase
LTKYRKLIVLLLLFGFSWATLVPPAVRDRVTMTYDPDSGTIDHSSELRLQLWSDALELFSTNPALGTGFHTYAYFKRVGSYEDTHNIYLKILVETGIVGILLFLWLLLKTFGLGLRLFWQSEDLLFRSLGLGLAAWIVCTAVSNLFGDRWTYFQINGYLWVITGLVARAFAIEADKEDQPAADEMVANAVPA